QCPEGRRHATSCQRESGFSGFLTFAEGRVEPGAGEGPVAVGGAADDAHGLGRLIEGEPGEETQLDEFRAGRIFLSELVEGVAEIEKFLGRFGEREVDLVEAQAPPTAAAL